jgi:Fe-S-cluster containining protein
MHPAAETWQDQLRKLDRWAESVAASHPDLIPCHRGCSSCCHGPFDVSAADTLLLREGLATLPVATREAVRTRGKLLLAKMWKLEPEWAAPWDLRDIDADRFDELAEQLSEEPCPMLDESGACAVYEYRPLICRIMGLPMMTAEGLVLENACPIQDEFPAYAALDPQLFDLEALELEETACLEAAATILFGSPSELGFETTIAAIAAG